MMVSVAIALAPAQNLGLGTGSRAPAADDSTAVNETRPDDSQAPAPRKNQINRRLGLTARRGKDFDPKQFEARGRELQGQFYEIGTPANNGKESGSAPMPGSTDAMVRKEGSKQWLIWVGVAGVAGASAGVVGYLMMNKSHPSPPADIPLVLTDEP